MSLKVLIYAYILGGLTFLPLLLCAAVAWTFYTSAPVPDPSPAGLEHRNLELPDESKHEPADASTPAAGDQPRPRKGWLTVRRTFEERETDGSYVNMMRSFLDSRSKDPKRSRPKDTWYVVLKGNVLYLYEDEAMTECEAAIQVSLHQVVIYPEGLMDGELFTKRNAICLKPLPPAVEKSMASVTRERGFEEEDFDKNTEELNADGKRKQKEKEWQEEILRTKTAEAKDEAFDSSTPWFIFIRSCVEMEDWYLALVHAASYSNYSSTLEPVHPVFLPSDMDHLVSTLDEQPDVIPMRWLNALLGRIFYSFYRTQNLESFIIGRLMKKLSKVKTPSFLQNISVTDVSVGNSAPTFSKPMLKELTKEGDAALEIRVMYRGEVRVTVEATAIINLGQRFKTYTVKLVLAVVLRKLDGNLLIRVKRPPTNRIWYAFTHPPELELDVEPVVSDRQIKWGMICSTIESRLKEIINESVVLPNMDDIAFFESSQYLHRGGIWADASRKPRETSDVRDEMTKPTSSASDTHLETLQKSQSADASFESTGSAPPNLSPESNIPRTETIAAPELAGSTSRRSRVESARSVRSNALNQESADDRQASSSEHLEPPEDGRGRSPTIETNGRRATSVPAAKSASAEDVEGNESISTSFRSGSALSPEPFSSQSAENPQELSLLAHSRMRSLSSGANVLTSSQQNSPRDSPPSRSGTLTNTSSFLSTLKSKADKQALSNTAKEAMRKWSANWNGFKRDHIGVSSNSEETADGESQNSGSLFTFPTKGRNYTDIRAAVSERKKDSSSSEDRPSSSSSVPIDIPGKRVTDENVDDFVHDSSLTSSVGASVPISPMPNQSNSSQSLSPKGPSFLRKDSNRSAPSPPKVTAETHSVDNAMHGQTAHGSNFSILPEVSVLAPPIKTQPSQGATMTIPGIHASHRGDVMSYGYVPPAPLATVPSEGKSRAPAIPPTIQSVYRLFKNPASGATVPQQRQQEHSPSFSTTSAEYPRQSGEPPQRLMEANNDIVPLSLSPLLSTVSADKTTASVNANLPPPLPPRSLPSPAPPSLPPRKEPGNVSPSINSTPEGVASSIAPSASDALKLIAEQDDTKRKDLEASSEQRPRPSSSKRSSLGARRIAPVFFPEETGLARDIPHDDGAPAASPRGEAESTERSVPTQTSAAIDGVRPQPPPLPPRRSSIPQSA
ncbi:hypothetical protein M0805_000952 [Coniferiporia weirii]|nr:hypothetical protein M0805_000952 [Coniferiporia weirii]